MCRTERMLQRAVEAAELSQHRKWKLGAVVAQGARVLSTSPNKFRNPPWINHLESTTHAEIAALARCLRSARGATVYVARVNGQGETRLARPCLVCMKALTLAGVGATVYTNNDGGYTVERLSPRV